MNDRNNTNKRSKQHPYNKKELSILLADFIFSSYPALVYMEKLLVDATTVVYYTEADTQYLISQGARNSDYIRVQTNRLPDLTCSAAIGAEELCRVLNRRLDESVNKRDIQQLQIVRWALTEMNIALDYMPALDAHVARQVYVDGLLKKDVTDLQGDCMSLHLVNEHLTPAVCCFAQCLRCYSMTTLEYYAEQIQLAAKAGESCLAKKTA